MEPVGHPHRDLYHRCRLAHDVLGVDDQQLGLVLALLVAHHQQVPRVLHLGAGGVRHEGDVPAEAALSQRAPLVQAGVEVVLHHRVEQRDGARRLPAPDPCGVAVAGGRAGEVSVHARELRREVRKGRRLHHRPLLEIDHEAVEGGLLVALLQHARVLRAALITFKEDVRHAQRSGHLGAAGDQHHLVLVRGVVPGVHDVVVVAAVRLDPLHRVG
mmetsp:Transcript_24287/g.52980  ORF Transcript_24287/g.52980 Transcript_24287/m.52980 type:complete len:215 (+) Transcript_24287:325-969(+)